MRATSPSTYTRVVSSAPAAIRCATFGGTIAGANRSSGPTSNWTASPSSA